MIQHYIRNLFKLKTLYQNVTKKNIISFEGKNMDFSIQEKRYGLSANIT